MSHCKAEGYHVSFYCYFSSYFFLFEFIFLAVNVFQNLFTIVSVDVVTINSNHK